MRGGADTPNTDAASACFPGNASMCVGLQVSGGNPGFVAAMDPIDELSVPGCLRVEIGTEAAVDEWVDHVAESQKKMEVEVLTQQRYDALRADAFKAFGGAAGIFEECFIMPRPAIESIGRRKFSPERGLSSPMRQLYQASSGDMSRQTSTRELKMRRMMKQPHGSMTRKIRKTTKSAEMQRTMRSGPISGLAS